MAASPDGGAGSDSSLILLADNDIILKLAACDFLNEAITVLGASRETFRVLPTARYKIEKDKKLLPRYGIDGITRALSFVKTCTQVDDVDLHGRADELVKTTGIDVGEALLIASAAGHPHSVLATGDKRSLVQLCKDPTKHTYLRAALAGRVVCFEAILLTLIRQPWVGFARVRERVVGGLLTEQPLEHRDGAMRAAFSRGMESDASDVEDTLAGYLEHLRHQTGDLLRF